MDVAQRLRDGVEALKAGRSGDAVAALRAVYEDADLAASQELADIRARVCSLYAQALLDDGQAEAAQGPVRDALRLLRKLRDTAGLTEVRALQDRVVAALAEARADDVRRAEQARIASTPLGDLLAHASDEPARVEARVKKAHALVEAGLLEEAADVAREAVAAAQALAHVQWEVLARIAWARAVPREAQVQLEAALQRADTANEFNLVSTIARAAEVAGVELPAHVGPHAPDGAS